MVQAIHDAAAHLGAECTNYAEADPGNDEGANKSVSAVMTKAEIREQFDLTKSSTSKEVGSPQETEESTAATADKAAATAEESADDAARIKAKQLELARGSLAYLRSKNIPND